MTIGAVVISRNDGYGGATHEKLVYSLTSMIHSLDEVIYVDWNSPSESLIEVIRDELPRTGKLRCITVTPQMHVDFTNDPEAQKCVEVLARNIGLRRLNTDWRISANGDVMCLGRETIEPHLTNPRAFYCVARRNCSFPSITAVGEPASEWLFEYLQRYIAEFPQAAAGSPLGPSDEWSLITCPGDFQIAHKDVWHGIRGFEESLVRRGYADSNVQGKAKLAGFDLTLMRDIPVFHFNHYADTGSCGGAFGAWNDRHAAIEGFTGTANGENWGLADVRFVEERI